jgi:hypothetical protein
MWHPPLRKCLERPPKRRHAVRQIPRLLLRHGELDMAEDELVIEFHRLGVVLRCTHEFVHDEQYCTLFATRKYVCMHACVYIHTLSSVIIELGYKEDRLQKVVLGSVHITCQEPKESSC